MVFTNIQIKKFLPSWGGAIIDIVEKAVIAQPEYLIEINANGLRMRQ
jgi:hypothetical protein